MDADQCNPSREADAVAPRIEIVSEVIPNQVSIARADDEFTSRVLECVQANGNVYPSHGAWRGRRITRVSVINHATDRAEIDLLVDEIRATGRKFACS